jgi:hypothetical protein
MRWWDYWGDAHTQTEHGLMVPIVKDADTKGLAQISSDVKVAHSTNLHLHAAADMRRETKRSIQARARARE